MEMTIRDKLSKILKDIVLFLKIFLSELYKSLGAVIHLAFKKYKLRKENNNEEVES